MAITISAEDATVAIRAAASADAIPAPVAKTVGYLWAATTALITEYAPQAPDAVHDAAAIRLLGWLYDSDPGDPLVGRAMQISGAAALLSSYRVHRAGAFGAAAAPAPGGGELPANPGPGSWILTYKDGTLQWIKFPLPA